MKRFTVKKNMLMGLAVVIVLSTAITVLYAGYCNPFEVSVTMNPNGGGSAYGTLSKTRISQDTSSYIGCGIKASTTSSYVWCRALDKNGNSLYGTSTNPLYVQIAKTIAKHSLIYFDVTVSDGQRPLLTWLQVLNKSEQVTLP